MPAEASGNGIAVLGGTFNPLLLECLKDIEGSLQAELKKDYQSDPAELEV